MTKFSISLLMLGAALATASAQGTDGGPFYVKASITAPFAETKVFLGDKSNGWGFEGGYDFAMPDSFSFISPWFAYSRFVGNTRTDFDPAITLDLPSPAFGLDVYQIGVNFKYQTPIKGLRPWIGVSVNWFDGNQITDGYAPGEFDLNGDPETKAHGLWNNHPKIGLRVGMDYFITSYLSAHIQFDASHWISDWEREVPGQDTLRVPGLNPMNPSWFSVSVGYHF
ncbi:MAG: porin family protein [Holophagales bacterium]|jgi:outer membrane protein W|nr:porin family protein [Holophagales bacterium]